MFAKLIKSNVALMLSILFIVATPILFFGLVDLKPKITADFFFSSDSKIYQQNKKINDEFPSQEQVIIGVPSHNIKSKDYKEKIELITNNLLKTKGISNVLSLTNGPSDLEEAFENPLWKRILLGQRDKATFIIATLSTKKYAETISKIEYITSQYEVAKNEIKISGMPYIVEQMRKNLQSDMKNFTLTAIVLCSLTLLVLFRSLKLMAASLVISLTASMLTIFALSLMGYSIGILTANLLVIAYILSQSHIIFLSSNIRKTNIKDAAVSKTFKASIWCMLTTLLGFASLIFVEAKPLKELGIGGVAATIIAFLTVYFIFIPILRYLEFKDSNKLSSYIKPIYSNDKYSRSISLIILIFAFVIGIIGIPKLDTDPSLLRYFKEDGKISKQIEYIDRNGGSSTLKVVISRADGEQLDNDESYQQMWKLQEDLNGLEEVGSVISLPIIMAEANENWLGSLLPWNIIIDQLLKPSFGEVAKSFINESRDKAVFILRMNESGMNRNRLDVINKISLIPQKYGFKLRATGGVYYLQGELAASVEKSLITGVMVLIIIFSIIVFIISRYFKLSIMVATSAAAISSIVFGLLGIFNVPVDIISSPAINIALGIAVDSIIHITRSAKDFGGYKRKHWVKALDEQAAPAIISVITVMVGFSIFAFSAFPPSQRFGVVIAIGSFISLLFVLIVLPALARKRDEISKN